MVKSAKGKRDETTYSGRKRERDKIKRDRLIEGRERGGE
jgi:hypothetical protein